MSGPSCPLTCYLNREIELDKVVCRFYANSKCEDGDKCHFPHVPREGRVLDSACRYFIRNKCHFGKLCSLDHVKFDNRDGKIMVQIIQQQLGTRKRQLESLNFVVKEPPSSNKDLQTDLVRDVCGAFANAELISGSEASNVSIPDPSKQCSNQCAKGKFDPSKQCAKGKCGLPNQCAKDRCLVIDSIKPITKCGDRKICETGSTESNLRDFCEVKPLQTPVYDVSNSTKMSENAQHLLKASTQSGLESGEQHPLGRAIAVERESKMFRCCGTSKTPVQNLSVKRSEEERRPTSGSCKSHSNREDRSPGRPFAAVNRSQACSGTNSSRKPRSIFDANESIVLYNTLIVPRGRMAEEIALYSDFSFVPVDSHSRVPLYMRGATSAEPTSDHVGNQTESAKRVDNNNFAPSAESTSDNVGKEAENGKKADGSSVANRAENGQKADESNGLSQQHSAEERFVYTPSGRRVGINRQYYPYQDRM